MGIFGALTGSPRSQLGLDPDDGQAGSPSATYVLSDFIDAVSAHDAPLLVLLGPVVNSNVEFLGTTVGCKLFVEDWPPPRAAEDPTGDDAGRDAVFMRLPVADASIHGVVCWDCFDYADAASRESLATELLRVLRPGGVMLFRQRADAKANPEPLRHEIVAPDRVRVQRSADLRRRIGPPLEQREVLRLLPGCVTVRTVLLRSRMRELLLRKAGPR